jgi:hypothetical protein
VAGTVWVTQEGDARDHVLQACDELLVDRRGLVAIQALGPSEIAIV